MPALSLFASIVAFAVECEAFKSTRLRIEGMHAEHPPESSPRRFWREIDIRVFTLGNVGINRIWMKSLLAKGARRTRKQRDAACNQIKRSDLRKLLPSGFSCLPNSRNIYAPFSPSLRENTLMLTDHRYRPRKLSTPPFLHLMSGCTAGCRWRLHILAARKNNERRKRKSENATQTAGERYVARENVGKRCNSAYMATLWIFMNRHFFRLLFSVCHSYKRCQKLSLTFFTLLNFFCFSRVAKPTPRVMNFLEE